MNLNILELLNGKTNKMEIHTKIIKDQFDFSGKKIIFAKPIEFNGTFSRRKNEFFLKGKCDMILQCDCDRCLNDFSMDFSFEVQEKYSKTPDNQEVKLIIGDFIDLYEVVEENLYLNMPIRVLCNEDCKGLCMFCGINLNKNHCQCKEEDIDGESTEQETNNGFSKLKDLF